MYKVSLKYSLSDFEAFINESFEFDFIVKIEYIELNLSFVSSIEYFSSILKTLSQGIIFRSTVHTI